MRPRIALISCARPHRNPRNSIMASRVVRIVWRVIEFGKGPIDQVIECPDEAQPELGSLHSEATSVVTAGDLFRNEAPG
jgi:hypothetical protein